jgi:membrane protein DedA with SNARE-associated domain
LLQDLVHWYLGALDTGGYWLIAAFMAIESSVLPLPSEFVVPPAAYLAAKTGRMSVAGVIVAATLGSWFGATVMYLLARFLGRPFVLRYGRYFGAGPQRVEGSEAWAKAYGPYGVFSARLLPVIRHLIGIPAGIVRMDFRWYSLATLLGSALWCSVLAYVGIRAGADQALMQGSLRSLTIWLGGGLLVLGVIYYFFVHRLMRRRA